MLPFWDEVGAGVPSGDFVETGASPGEETGTGAPYTGLVDLGGPFGGLRASGVKMTFLVRKRLIFSGIFTFLLSESPQYPTTGFK